MGIEYLPPDEQKRVRWVLDWIGRMVQKYGGTVYEKGNGWWDWGQALCRECYGKDWIEKVPDTPTWDDIKRAQDWENGKIPSWVDKRKTSRKHNFSVPIYIGIPEEKIKSEFLKEDSR